MKSIITKSTLLLLAALPLFTACQDEPEVGSTLYPTEQENYGPKAYINEIGGAGNEAAVEVVQTPVALMLPEEGSISFRVKLTAPVDNDVTVNIVADTEKAAAYKSGCEALPAAGFQIKNAQVRIPAGEMVSAEAVEVSLVDGDAIRNLENTSVIALTLSDATGGVAVGKNNNTYYAVVSKKVTNYKGQNVADLEGRTQIPYDSYTVTDDYGDDYTAELSDGDNSTDCYGYYEFYLMATFTNPTPVSALVFHAGTYYPYYYTPKIVEVLTSNDGEEWTSQTGGTVTSTIRPSSATTPIPFVLYSPITCKYVKFRVENSFYWGYSYVSELKLYQ